MTDELQTVELQTVELQAVELQAVELQTVAFGVDVNGCPTEDLDVGGSAIRIHYDDVPESDITTVDGIRVTTPLRTVIDLAAELDGTELDRLVQTFLDRRLFSLAEAIVRLDQPDMASRPGARVLRAHLRQRRRKHGLRAHVDPVKDRRGGS